MGNREPAGWPENLFIKHARIFLPVFRYSRETEQEVKGIIGIFEQFKVPKGSRILDVPCGVGRHAIPLARRGYNVTGVDFSPLFISRAHANARKQKVAKRNRSTQSSAFGHQLGTMARKRTCECSQRSKQLHHLASF